MVTIAVLLPELVGEQTAVKSTSPLGLITTGKVDEPPKIEMSLLLGVGFEEDRIDGGHTPAQSGAVSSEDSVERIADRFHLLVIA
jgi:hypothetical protein